MIIDSELNINFSTIRYDSNFAYLQQYKPINSIRSSYSHVCIVLIFSYPKFSDYKYSFTKTGSYYGSGRSENDILNIGTV